MDQPCILASKNINPFLLAWQESLANVATCNATPLPPTTQATESGKDKLTKSEDKILG